MMINRLLTAPFVIACFLYYKLKLGSFHFSSRILSPLRLDGMSNIRIGKNTIIQYKTWLAALPLTGEKTSTLDIGDGVVIGNFNHIYATQKIVIEDNVLTADKVYISDNLHGYKNINLPIVKQPVEQNGVVIIGRGSWLGENVCVLGSKIGKHCVVGANAVVTKDIPDYSVAVGIPARVIRRYNFSTQQWESIDKDI